VHDGFCNIDDLRVKLVQLKNIQGFSTSF